MTDTAKEWVTVKVPREKRERAADYKPEGVTWGECLTAGAERLNDDLDSDTTSHVNGDTLTATVRPELDDDAVRDLMEEIAVAAEPERGMVDDTELAREVARQVDYAELAKQVADELEGRMR